MNKDRFNFYVPIEIEKSKGDTKKEDRYKNMVFHGLASDNSKDMDDEMLEPSGYDLDYFLHNGFFNYDHMAKATGDSSFFIGEPLEANIDGDKLFVKGKLWEASQKAREVWDTILTMQESGSNRKMGMSIEGQALERDKNNPKRVTKARITGIAITMNPCNSNSWLDIIKGQQKEDYIEAVSDDDDSDNDIIRELEIDGQVYLLKKDFTVVKKTMDIAAVAPITVQSIDDKIRDETSITAVSKHLNIIKEAVEKGIIDKKIISL